MHRGRCPTEVSMDRVRVSTRVSTVAENHGNLESTLIELRAQKSALEKRLAELERHRTLTPAEQVERVRIKKEKLLIKDRLLALGAL